MNRSGRPPVLETPSWPQPFLGRCVSERLWGMARQNCVGIVNSALQDEDVAALEGQVAAQERQLAELRASNGVEALQELKQQLQQVPFFFVPSRTVHLEVVLANRGPNMPLASGRGTGSQ